MPDGSIAHAEVLIEGSVLMMAEENAQWKSFSPLTIGGSPVTLSLYAADVDAVFNQAVVAGATATMPVMDMFYGDRTGSLVDPYGHKWMITTHKKDMSFEEMQKEGDKMFGGSK